MTAAPRSAAQRSRETPSRAANRLAVNARIFAAAAASLLLLLGASPSTPAGRGDGSAYDAFVRGATAQRGLFTLWQKNGKLYLELTPAQLGHDFVQTIVPSSGVGGDFIVWGNTDHLPAELVRFERAGNQIAIVWPTPYFIAPGDPGAERAIDHSFARSIVGTAPIVATDDKTGDVIFDAAPFLGDQLNLKKVFAQGLRGSKGTPYTLDPDRTYFAAPKAFPKNVIIEARQDWTSPDENLADSVPDPRHVQMRVTYNIADVTPSTDYRPRLADDRIGIYDDIYLQFDDDRAPTRKLRYVVRWNLQPSDPSKPVSPATHPMVFYMSNTVPQKYRAAIRAAVLKWNAAFLPLGISDAVQVRDQPDDPNWDPDDIRYNVLRWVTEWRPSFGADSQTLYDPRTGEEFRTGILISADVPLSAEREWRDVVDPARYGRSTDPMPQKYLDDVWLGTIMHETGHNLGMQHNFIGSMAYSAKELQDPTFTAKYGIASTVMEYAPTNVWPRRYGQGTYSQTVLGPYDYHLIQWAYARIPGANTPQEELPTLGRWASAWSDPRYRYESDEDVSWGNGHASDPRAEQGDLTNDPLRWCGVQLGLDRDLVAHLDARYPQAGEAYQDETDAFRFLYGRYAGCATLPAHFIGGQYLSRAHRGDPGAQAPIVPVPRTEQRRAFDVLARYLFAANPLHASAALLSHLGYSEWAGYGYVSYEGYGNLPQWAYDPPERHDVPLAEDIARLQDGVLKEMFSPQVLARIADGPAETSDRNPMQLADLFTWTHDAAFSEFRGRFPRAIAPQRRTLQQHYAALLATLANAPPAGTPDDARALARAQLAYIEAEASRAQASPRVDRTTRAHLDLLRSRAYDALHPQQ